MNIVFKPKTHLTIYNLFHWQQTGETVDQNWRPGCNECPYMDHPVVIVGSRRFSIEILANFITNNTPAKWSIVEHLRDVSPPVDTNKSTWRLIFVDCLALACGDIMTLMKTEAAPFLQQDIVALFNLSRNNTCFPELIDLGVHGFFFENDQAEFLLKGICALKNGELWVARGTLMEYVCHRPRKATPENNTARLLTAREKDVLGLLASGATNDEIASRLFVSLHTVKSHLHNILKKLGLQNRLQAALWAARHLE